MSPLDIVRRPRLLPGAITMEDCMSINAELRLLYLLYCLSILCS